MLVVHSLPRFRKLDWVSWVCPLFQLRAVLKPLITLYTRQQREVCLTLRVLCTNCINGYCVFAFTGNLPFLQECVSNRVRPCPASTTITLSSLSSCDYHVFPPSTHLSIYVIPSSTHMSIMCPPPPFPLHHPLSTHMTIICPLPLVTWLSCDPSSGVCKWSR